MFCYQCEQTAKGKGCSEFGVCGKDPDTACLQDALTFVVKGVGFHAHEAGRRGASDPEIDRFILEALFTTVTNVNFDPERVAALVRRGAELRSRALKLAQQSAKAAGETPAAPPPAASEPIPGDMQAMIGMGRQLAEASLKDPAGPDIKGLRDLVLFGLKGTAAYADHALILGRESREIHAGFQRLLAFLAGDPSDADKLLNAALEVGALNLSVMELLDRANTGAYGHPSPAKVRITPRKGKAILVSGHDLKDLAALLEQTEGTGINVYTHGEMLPAHGYPELRKHKHLAGNYGGAWQEQHSEFDAFPGAILMTTNCIQKPRDTYKDRIFTCGLTAWPGVIHIKNRDFSPVIQAAMRAPGFEADGEDKTILAGFGHEAVLGVADKVIEAVKTGRIRRFFLIGGCDGAKPGRNYYTDFAKAVPKDCVILTLACGKYRFNKLEFGDIAGIPRLLDIGQCNDAYSAIRIAEALASAFDCGVNDLPLSLVLSWYEQKAVCILLSLLKLGIRDIRLGPSLPAFITPPVLNILVEKFGIKPIDTAENDLKAILGRA